jgi:hypothetical protein
LVQQTHRKLRSVVEGTWFMGRLAIGPRSNEVQRAN